MAEVLLVRIARLREVLTRVGVRILTRSGGVGWGVILLCSGQPTHGNKSDLLLFNDTTNMPWQDLMDVNSKYVIDGKEIGRGHYGVVRSCTSRGKTADQPASC